MFSSEETQNNLPPFIQTIADPVMADFISKLQLNLTHSAEVIVGSQAGIYVLNSNMGDVPEYHTTIWVAMRDIMKNWFHIEQCWKNYM